MKGSGKKAKKRKAAESSMVSPPHAKRAELSPSSFQPAALKNSSSLAPSWLLPKPPESAEVKKLRLELEALREYKRKAEEPPLTMREQEMKAELDKAKAQLSAQEDRISKRRKNAASSRTVPIVPELQELLRPLCVDRKPTVCFIRTYMHAPPYNIRTRSLFLNDEPRATSPKLFAVIRL